MAHSEEMEAAFLVRMPMWLRRELRQLAVERDTSMGQLVRENMEKFVREARGARGEREKART